MYQGGDEEGGEGGAEGPAKSAGGEKDVMMKELSGGPVPAAPEFGGRTRAGDGAEGIERLHSRQPECCRDRVDAERQGEIEGDDFAGAVPYTHLTLPTLD